MNGTLIATPLSRSEVWHRSGHGAQAFQVTLCVPIIDMIWTHGIDREQWNAVICPDVVLSIDASSITLVGCNTDTQQAHLRVDVTVTDFWPDGQPGWYSLEDRIPSHPGWYPVQDREGWVFRARYAHQDGSSAWLESDSRPVNAIAFWQDETLVELELENKQ